MLSQTIGRRGFLAGVASTVAAGSGLLWSGAAQAADAFELPKLPYAFDALEPYIDARTMEIHHDKHHAAYVKNLNAALQGVDVAGKTVDQIIANLDALPETIRTAVRNNGGGHANHSLFWNLMSAKGGKPSGALAKAIDSELGGYDAFVQALTKAGMTRFGSGWGWLIYSPKTKRLAIESSPNQDSPVMAGNVPLLGVDVWEHAYYLKYQNRRDEYLKAWFNVVNWDYVAARYNDALKQG